MAKIKAVPRDTTKSVAALVYLPDLAEALLDKCPSNWYHKIYSPVNLNFSLWGCREEK